MSNEYVAKEIAEFLSKYGCFCGGSGKYTDYNCGGSYELTCPHCRGKGIRREACACEQPELKCPERFK
jgi:hypothetical protein